MMRAKVFYKEHKIFGQMVREARQKMQLSLEEVGEALDLHPGSLRQIELGYQGVYLRNAIQLANALGFSLSDLQKRASEGEAANEIKKKLLEIKKTALDEKIAEVRTLNDQYQKIERMM